MNEFLSTRLAIWRDPEKRVVWKEGFLFGVYVGVAVTIMVALIALAVSGPVIDNPFTIAWIMIKDIF